MDTNNHIIKLCTEAMAHEVQGRKDVAYKIYLQAWNEAKDDYEKCIAAHYVAKYQTNFEDILKWNQYSLEHAKKVEYEKIKGFYPSLYLNMGKSYEDLEDLEKAKSYYNLAADESNQLADDTYGASVIDGVERGVKRINQKL